SPINPASGVNARCPTAEAASNHEMRRTGGSRSLRHAADAGSEPCACAGAGADAALPPLDPLTNVVTLTYHAGTGQPQFAFPIRPLSRSAVARCSLAAAQTWSSG